MLGLHPVLGVPGCFLLEVEIVGASEPPDFGLFVQAAPGSPPSNWQVAWDERLLDPTGSVVVAELWSTSLPSPWPQRARVAFFLHDVDLAQPLATPFGDVSLPEPTARPGRLDAIRYEAP